jgi:acyl carrier protein
MSANLKQVMETICRVGNLSEVGPDDDFYDAGFSSVRSLELLIELETVFGVSIPDDQFIAARTPLAVAGLMDRLHVEVS